ncbi:putative FAD-binding domain-containing protein [Seiridium cardinale]|uniref:FAD-binding domain-containing protein n=1 Tax=Seiridium cardinale TaxID=138064 RepID=A0ABR2XR47_9PEZI
MPQMKVLVIGGGIAGPAVSFWLSKAGVDVTVIERFPNLRTTGLQIDLRGAGIEVMRRMGLEAAFRAKAVPEQGTAVVDGSGRLRAVFEANRSGQGLQDFTTDFEIMRGDLCQLLYDATKDRVNYVFGTTVRSVEDVNGAAKVLFSDGREEQYDLVIGADGQASRTRRMLFGPDTEDNYHLLGAYIAYFTLPEAVKGDDYLFKGFFAPGKRLILTRRSSPENVQVYLACKSESDRLRNLKKGDVKEEKEAMTEVFRDAGWRTNEFLQKLESTDDFYCERLAVVRLDSWSRGRTALLGDAAYCPTATTGMGTTSSMVGSYILAGEIVRHCVNAKDNGDHGGRDFKDGLAVALKNYEDKFRPFMDRVQKGIRNGTTIWDKLPATSLAITILNFVLGIVSFFHLNVLGRYILRENVGDWKLPEYKELS